MLNRILLLSFLVSLFATPYGFSQTDQSNIRPGENVEYCTSHKKHNELLKNPVYLNGYNIDQRQLKLAEEAYLNNPSKNRVVYKVPVVFHILHNGGIENISNEQIFDAVKILNRDFRLLNEDAKDVVYDFNASNPNAVATPADIEFEFVLATKAPNGTCFNGITRTLSRESYSGNGTTQLNTVRSRNDVYQGEWAGDQYLNIIVCGDIGGSAGYTFTPSSYIANKMENGIFMLHNYVGSIGTGTIGRDRTLTHEVGHWFNLAHVWGPNNNPGDAASCNTDDGVTDTPNTIGTTACYLNENTCGPKANVENYMDYSACSKMFTHGQKARMVAAITSSVGGRNNIWKTANLTKTGADGNLNLCKADFSVQKEKLCTGETIQFTDNSFHNVNSWNWSFPGAVNTTSTAQNPSVTYLNPGTYSVTLTVGDGKSTLTSTKTSYITVFSEALKLPFLEDFESTTSISTSPLWEVSNPQKNAAFQISSNAGHMSSKSLYLANYTQTGPNVDELISRPFDLSHVTSSANVTLSFRFSYRKKNDTDNEKLYVQISQNCGDTWVTRKTISGTNLSGTALSTNWIPKADTSWTTVHLTSISSSYWNDNFRFKIKFEGNTGNNLYIDNINIYDGAPTSELISNQNAIDENTIDNTKLILYPNPTEGELNISYNSQNGSPTLIKVYDLLGNIINSYNVNTATGSNIAIIDTYGFAQGCYIVDMQIDGNSYKKQFQVK